MADDKIYIGEMILGITTDTGDAEGKTLNTKPETLNKPQVSKEEIQNLFRKFTGEIEQVPPMFSAKKINGQPLYKLARKGITVKREPRRVTIYELRITDYDDRIAFYVHCSKGTYIRQLVVDIGDELGTGAHLSALRRIKSGKFTIEQAQTIDTLIGLAQEDKLESAIINP
jgi:tRNA pseudouridine55 synthase